MDFRNEVDDILKACTTAFGEEVRFFPKSGGMFAIRGIYDQEYREVDLDTNKPITDVQPTLGINLNDVKFELKKKVCEVEIRNVRYNVIDVRPDGQGGALLMLHRMKKDESNPESKAT